MAHYTSDGLIREALTSGVFTTDPRTGYVYKMGQRVGGRRLDGYISISYGYGRAFLAHRMIWIAANGPIPPSLQVNHRNMNKDDNRLTNLELVTPAENAWHALRQQRYTRPRPEDEAVVNADWLALARLIAADGGGTAEQIDMLRALARSGHGV